MAASAARAESLSKTFYRRLVWRDLAYWQLFHWPDMATEPIRRHYVDQEWSSGPAAAAHLSAWQKGQTGFPLVDAGQYQNHSCVCLEYLQAPSRLLGFPTVHTATQPTHTCR
jgi:deoxyribodipyrimidine photolyase